MNLLVTGAAGFIGSTHVRALPASPESDAFRSTVPDKLTYAGTLGNLELDGPRPEFVQGGIRDELGHRPRHDVAAGLALAGMPGRPVLTTELPDGGAFARTARFRRDTVDVVDDHRALAHGGRQQPGLPSLRDRRTALHEALTRIRKECPA